MTDSQIVEGHSSKNNSAKNERRVISEDANAGMASPIMDLVAAIVVAAIPSPATSSPRLACCRF